MPSIDVNTSIVPVTTNLSDTMVTVNANSSYIDIATGILGLTAVFILIVCGYIIKLIPFGKPKK